MADRLANRGAVVTGAAGGIGTAIATELAGEGARVVCVDVNLEGATSTAETILANGGSAWALQYDCTDPAQVRELDRRCGELVGRVDALCTTVGGAVEQPFLEIEPEVWQANIDLNLNSAYLCSRTFAKHMAAHGGGAIVIISSQLGTVGRKGLAHYCSAKAALIQLVKVMALELSEYGIRANTIAPGPTETPLLLEAFAAFPDAYDELISQIPIGRAGRPTDIGRAAVFLASDDAAFVTGATLLVDGGYVAA